MVITQSLLNTLFMEGIMESIIHMIADLVIGKPCRDVVIALDRGDPGYDWQAVKDLVDEVIHHDAFTIDEIRAILKGEDHK